MIVKLRNESENYLLESKLAHNKVIFAIFNCKLHYIARLEVCRRDADINRIAVIGRYTVLLMIDAIEECTMPQ